MADRMTDGSRYEDIIYRERPASKRPPMDISHRAKQFAPFAALKGFEEAVYAKEILLEERRELSEEKKAELDGMLRALRTGQKISVTYFEEEEEWPGKGYYRTVEGTVECWKTGMSLKVGGEEIPIGEIVEIE